MTYRPSNPLHGTYNVRFFGKWEMTVHLFEGVKKVRTTCHFTKTRMALHLTLLTSLSLSEIPIQISTPCSLVFLSSTLVMAMASILYSSCRSTLHQGPDSDWVRVQVALSAGSLFPSTALPAAAASFSDDWTAGLFSATFRTTCPN